MGCWLAAASRTPRLGLFHLLRAGERHPGRAGPGIWGRLGHRGNLSNLQGGTGLDHYFVRQYTGRHRRTTLAVFVHRLLTWRQKTNTAPSNATTKPAATPHKHDCSTGKVRGRLLDPAGAVQCPRKRRNSGSTVSGSMFSRPATCSMSTSWTSSRTCHGASHSASTGWR